LHLAQCQEQGGAEQKTMAGVSHNTAITDFYDALCTPIICHNLRCAKLAPESECGKNVKRALFNFPSQQKP
jgi:hypothetical protein